MDNKKRIEDTTTTHIDKEAISKCIDDELGAISSAEMYLEVLADATDVRFKPIIKELNNIINDAYKKIEIYIKKMKDLKKGV